MAAIEDDLRSLRSFAHYFTLSFYTGSARSFVEENNSTPLMFWYSGLGPLPRPASKRVLHGLLPYVRNQMVSESWASSQKQQKEIRFVQMCSNGGRDPFPQTGFLEPWLELSKGLDRPPLYLLEIMLSTSLVLIGKINNSIDALMWQDVTTRDALRAALLPLFDAAWVEPDLTDRPPAIPSTFLEEVFIPQHPAWKDRVAFPVQVPISRSELTALCEAVCTKASHAGGKSSRAKGEQVAFTPDGRVLEVNAGSGPVIAEVFMDEETGEMLTERVPGRKLKSVMQARGQM